MVNSKKIRSVMHLGDNLYKVRNQRNITRARLAEMVGLSDQRIIYDYENNVKRPTIERLILIANALNVTLDSLVI